MRDRFCTRVPDDVPAEVQLREGRLLAECRGDSLKTFRNDDSFVQEQIMEEASRRRDQGREIMEERLWRNHGCEIMEEK